MQLLERVHLVQFFLFEAQTLELDAHQRHHRAQWRRQERAAGCAADRAAGRRPQPHPLQRAGRRQPSRTHHPRLLPGRVSQRRGRPQAAHRHHLHQPGVPRPPTAATAADRRHRAGRHRRTSPSTACTACTCCRAWRWTLDDHVERINGKELPLAWPPSANCWRRCRKAAGRGRTAFRQRALLKDLLLRLRAAPTASPDVNAYRKAFQNALNLQRVEDVDSVRAHAGGRRPAHRHRPLPRAAGQLPPDQGKDRTGSGSASAPPKAWSAQYEKIAQQATRAAAPARWPRSMRATCWRTGGAGRRRLTEALKRSWPPPAARWAKPRSERDTLREDAHGRRQARLQGSAGYGEQAQLDELAGRDRGELAQLKQANSLRSVGFVREQWQAARALALPRWIARRAGRRRRQRGSAGMRAVGARRWMQNCRGRRRTLFARSAPGAAPPRSRCASRRRPRPRSCTPHDKGAMPAGRARQNQKRLAAGQAELHPTWCG
jgi:chromosome segregation protein